LEKKKRELKLKAQGGGRSKRHRGMVLSKQKSREDVNKLTKPAGSYNPSGGVLNARKFGAAQRMIDSSNSKTNKN
jgi:hypothetical protein